MKIKTISKKCTRYSQIPTFNLILQFWNKNNFDISRPNVKNTLELILNATLRSTVNYRRIMINTRLSTAECIKITSSFSKPQHEYGCLDTLQNYIILKFCQRKHILT